MALLEHIAPDSNHASRERTRFDRRRLAPVVLAGGLSAIYLIASPPSLDLAVHFFRAQLFDAQGFGIWNNWWYGGHHIPGYSVLFPAAAAALGPRLAAALAATATAALFEPLAHRRFGASAWLGALWFGAASATNLFTGRLTFAFGLLPAVASLLALQRNKTALAAALSVITALASPVAALFLGLSGAAHATGALTRQRTARAALPGAAVAAGAVLPVLAIAFAFPEGGSEPFALGAFWPMIVIGVLTFFVLPRQEAELRAAAILYVFGCVAAFALATPVGGNASRLGTLVAGPLAALIWWPQRKRLLLLLAPALLYVQWQAPVRDVTTSLRDQAASGSFYRPILSFLSHQRGAPFRVEIPFTSFHWEAYQVAQRFPLARGWERQLDIADNPLFYRSGLTAASYETWLHLLAIRFVALPDAALDYSAKAESALINRGLPYLRLVLQTRHWRVYEVRDPTPLAQGAAKVTAIGSSSVTLVARRPGAVLLRVRYTPYWKLGEGSGCVSPAGRFTELALRKPGPAKLVIRFSFSRIAARSPRCT